MSDVLSLFPARIEIGQFTGPDGRPVKVYASPEFNRALAATLERIGGPTGTDTASIELAASYQPAQLPVADVDPAASYQPTPLPVADVDPGAALVQACDALANSLVLLEAARAEMGGLVRRIEGLEAQLQPAPAGTDWEHPGKIGEFTRNSGKFTLVWSNTEFRRTAAAATAGYMLNQLDGASNGNGLYWSGAKVQLVVGAGVIGDFSATGLAVTGDLSATAINGTPIGQTTPRNGTFSILKSMNEFGCNGATPRAPLALGAAATDLATTQALANNIRTALINNGIGS